jgi:N-acetylneuraminate lyase
MRYTHLKGLIAAPFTPMHLDGTINIELIPEYYQLLKSNGVKGAFITGSTGEGPSLTTGEKKAVIAAWADCNKGDTDFKVIWLNLLLNRVYMVYPLRLLIILNHLI